MDYLGHSILSLQSSDPATLAAIVALQAEVAVIETEIGLLQNEAKTQEGQITSVQGQITSLQNDVKTQEGEITTLRTQVGDLNRDIVDVSSQINNLDASVRALQNAPNIADCGSLVLTCPVTTDTATLRVTVSTDWDNFYYTGYSPSGSPFNLTPFVAVNFQRLIDSNPIGVYWQRPPAATGATAAFEIDATASFIPSVDMGVRVGVKVLSSLLSVTPLFYFGYNEQRYRPSANVATWSARIIVRVPLRDASNVESNYIVFQVEALTLAATPQQFVYGIGESFSNQHHLIVRRIQ